MSQSNPFYKLINELSDIFGEWDDVMDTAYELEQLLTDGMSQLANFDYASIADDVQQGLNEVKEKLEDANLLDGLGDQIQEALKDLKDQVNIDLEAPFDVPDIGDLSNLKELIGKYLPDVPGVDFGPMTDAITKLMNLIDLPDIDVALRKTSGGSYPEGIEAAAQSAMQAAIPPTTSSNINTAQTATNGTSNAATGTPPNNDWLQAMIPDWKIHEEAIEGLMTKLESAFDELTIMDQVQASMDKLMPQIEQLKTVADITPILTTLIKDVGSEVAPTLKKVLDIFTEAFEDFKKLLISLKAAKLPKDLNANQWYQLLTFGGGKEPGLLTIPCLVLALPLCFMSKALTGKRPELGGVFQKNEDGLSIAITVFEFILGLSYALESIGKRLQGQPNTIWKKWRKLTLPFVEDKPNWQKFTIKFLELGTNALLTRLSVDSGIADRKNRECDKGRFNFAIFILEIIFYLCSPVLHFLIGLIYHSKGEQKNIKSAILNWTEYDSKFKKNYQLIFDGAIGGLLMGILYVINVINSNDEKDKARTVVTGIQTFLGGLKVTIQFFSERKNRTYPKNNLGNWSTPNNTSTPAQQKPSENTEQNNNNPKTSADTKKEPNSSQSKSPENTEQNNNNPKTSVDTKKELIDSQSKPSENAEQNNSNPKTSADTKKEPNSSQSKSPENTEQNNNNPKTSVDTKKEPNDSKSKSPENTEQNNNNPKTSVDTKKEPNDSQGKPSENAEQNNSNSKTSTDTKKAPNDSQSKSPENAEQNNSNSKTSADTKKEHNGSQSKSQETGEESGNTETK